MEIISHDVPDYQLPLFLELAKALGIRLEKKEKQADEKTEIEAAINRIENGHPR